LKGVFTMIRVEKLMDLAIPFLALGLVCLVNFIK
jgi:hypothetical protein